METIYTDILWAKANNKKLLAVLLDPDKVTVTTLVITIEKINQSPATHILVGGSSFEGTNLEDIIVLIKKNTALPVILFPGSPYQLSAKADGVFFLMLLSGRNPDYLIDFQVKSVPFLEKTALEVMSTGYILIASGNETAVQRVSQTQPIDRDDIKLVCHTAKAGEYLGNKLIYLEAGSGAQYSVPLEMIQQVAQTTSLPLVVGGGIRSQKEIEQAYASGATMVVIGTAFENNSNFFQND